MWVANTVTHYHERLYLDVPCPVSATTDGRFSKTTTFDNNGGTEKHNTTATTMCIVRDE